MIKQGWIKYGALLVLAVVAIGLAGLAFAKQSGSDEATSPATASTSASTPVATATQAPTPTPKASPTAQRLGIQLPADPVLLILGDSYTAGVGADRPDQGWAYQVAGSLGYPTNIDGVPGTGFAWGGGAQGNLALDYEVRLQEMASDTTFVPNVLILQGGQSDTLTNNPQEIQSATARTIETARKIWPGVQVVVLGPTAPHPIAEVLRSANSAIRAGAAAANAPFVDALDAGWFTDSNSSKFYFDGADVNTAGHAHIAEKFLESWATLVQ